MKMGAVVYSSRTRMSSDVRPEASISQSMAVFSRPGVSSAAKAKVGELLVLGDEIASDARLFGARDVIHDGRGEVVVDAQEVERCGDCSRSPSRTTEKPGEKSLVVLEHVLGVLAAKERLQEESVEVAVRATRGRHVQLMLRSRLEIAEVERDADLGRWEASRRIGTARPWASKRW